MKLFQLSEHCEFGEAKEEHIRDQLIDKCTKSHNLRKKLLKAGGTLTLQKAREIAKSMEAAERQAKQIENDSRSENVHTLEDHHHVSRRGKRGWCYRCGIEGHFARDPECKARSVTCSKCRKIGHMAKWYRTKVENNTKGGNVHQISEDDFAFHFNQTLETYQPLTLNLEGSKEKARAILSRQTSQILAILKIEINSVSEENLLREFPRIFNGVGKLKDFQAKFHNDESVEPTAQKLRPSPFGLSEKIEEKLEELVNHDVIEQVQGPTPWVSPVVVVPKPTGDIRVCVDMRKANRTIVRERHPIPTVDDVLYQLNGSTIFSKLDLKWGFHLIELEEQSRNITTFVTHKVLYRYKRLMFDISSAPELYQHTIQQVLAGCEGAYSIHDDIIIHGCSVDEHDARLKKTMGPIQDKGLTLSREKCVFQMSKLTFMGYLLSNKGIGPTESRVEAVVTAREPQNAGEVRSFLGLVNFSARFIRNLASIAEPLHRLTRRETPFVWGTEQQPAFDTLKSSLANAETLAYFKRNAEKTKLITDASPVGLGAVLTQVQGGCEWVVAYASRSLTDVERKLVLRGTRLLIPHKLRKRVLDLAHEGHQGLVKTKERLRTKVWWAGIDKQVEDKCKTCHGCQLVRLPTPPEPLRHTEFPDQPWQDLAGDLMGPLPSGEYVFVVVDYYSRYFEVTIMKFVTSTNVIESLEKIFCTHGLPKSLKTDNGPQFASEKKVVIPESK
ncbi:PREDICTED: uncharacterized protein K02A2.6-like [Acropora digitifera]|uniref:uncharacterized protein K02A2.6-like n=1 Tax=Acropora digitifera TaxID=70779 RepID=UPI00077A0A37|nr:PREDICTED: uncharacterized protein K02A2.6-like [Acropora digitifera]